MIVVFADVAENDGGDSGIKIFGDKFRREFVGEMTAATHHALLYGPRIRTNAKHFEIVVRFEQNELAASQMHPQGIRDITEIRRDSYFDALR
jgi:hypothetical protein